MSVDEFITTRMREHGIAAVSLAVVNDGEIAREKGYGFTDKVAEIPVSPETLLQAGSISKVPAALAALLLVEQGRLSLEDDVNAQLRTWKLPENEYTQARKVTLRGILSHNAGLSIHGFAGYPVNAPLPTLPQILDGIAPANNSPIRVITEP